MKTLRLIGTTLLMVVLCLNFTACGDDDDDDPSNPIVGVWQNDESIYFMTMIVNHTHISLLTLMIVNPVH